MPRLPLFGDRLADAVRATAPLCLGLDPHLDRLPAPLRARFEGRSGADRRKAAADVTLRLMAMLGGSLGDGDDEEEEDGDKGSSSGGAASKE